MSIPWWPCVTNSSGGVSLSRLLLTSTSPISASEEIRYNFGTFEERKFCRFSVQATPAKAFSVFPNLLCKQGSGDSNLNLLFGMRPSLASIALSRRRCEDELRPRWLPNLKKLARDADIFIVSTASAKHAATSFISANRPSPAVTLFHNTRGSQSMLALLERHLATQDT